MKTKKLREMVPGDIFSISLEDGYRYNICLRKVIGGINVLTMDSNVKYVNHAFIRYEPKDAVAVDWYLFEPPMKRVLRPKE